MAPPRSYVRAWHAWRRTELPAGALRDGRGRTPAFGVVLDLDHLRSHLAGLGAAVEAGRPLDFEALAADNLAELQAIEAALDALALPDAERAPLRAYVGSTRALLRELARLDAGPRPV